MTEEFIIEQFKLLKHDPYQFVLFSFPWGEGSLTGYTLEDWQKETLIDLGNDLKAGRKTVTEAIQHAVASGHGVGKSSLVAWLILWAMATCADTRGIITANTETQLRTKTWAELAKWHSLFIARHWFTLTATAIYSASPAREKTWRIDIIPWSVTKPESFAGLHNKGKRILVIFDEASAIPDKIWEVTEGALTDSDTEIIWAVFGNPTRSNGRFHSCYHALKHRWKTRQVDSRTVRISNKKQIDKWIEDYGEDSDFVRIRVRGEFPKQSDRQFISSEVVQQARGRHLLIDQYDFAAKIISVDPAWTGGDEFVIALRQGLAFKILQRFQKNDDDMKMAGYVAQHEDVEKADAVFIDFGYGSGIYSAGKNMGRTWQLIPFGGASINPGFVNKRAEMWGLMKEWMMNGGAIPDDPMLCEELCGPEYYIVASGPNAGKIVLESKEDMKSRGLTSPNRADALALTFAFPVKPKRNEIQTKKTLAMCNSSYDILK